jgi:hypothetical protein
VTAGETSNIPAPNTLDHASVLLRNLSKELLRQRWIALEARAELIDGQAKSTSEARLRAAGM